MLRLMPRERSRSEGASAPVRTLRRCASLDLRLCCVSACRRYAKEADVCLLHNRERTTLRLALEPVREIHHGATAAISTPHAQRDAFSWAEPSMHPTRAKDTSRQLDEIAPNRNARCRVASCTSYARNGGCCTRHGGGRKCLMEHCTTPSQTGGLCRLHGGGTRCKLEGCTKFARVRGLCSVHFRFADVQGM
ncbi:hypothetical protein SDRG_02412 [Saprolegnia diclina VS20]|uniref:WRKY19-like zinc finger domain-containing protein n=1 Tax=Saprolegnia diclina (strain VS20) TaxID=1156394 RepID=T0SCI9_SAPDV|nr:hypothetical protein SDRG_02412 [Saprolegnia diclina VS20]EQC40522.1 hypothetical protein SDRG_02412 [Saprolegnia diclina VS20]|eukprot:XP_008606221.1 hypothetical protein SDRG_02412 [Saprolegnia diclina VS20]